jgi:tRNA(Arg) A34 adenosine deaminase TadA
MRRRPASTAIERAADARFMRRALALARRGMTAGDGGPFGAVVVREGAIVGEGWNRVVATRDPTAHGEIVAIRAACRQLGTFELAGCEVYTSGEPCPMCLSAMYWARIARIFFGFTVADAARIGFDDRVIYRELARPAGRRTIPTRQLLAVEARAVAREYAANPRRATY